MVRRLFLLLLITRSHLPPSPLPLPRRTPLLPIAAVPPMMMMTHVSRHILDQLRPAPDVHHLQYRALAGRQRRDLVPCPAGAEYTELGVVWIERTS